MQTRTARSIDHGRTEHAAKVVLHSGVFKASFAGYLDDLLA